MNKIYIAAADELFLKDLSEQILQEIPKTEIIDAHPEMADLILADESFADLQKLQDNIKKPVILFSSKEDTSEFADVVIKKPFTLSKFLWALENKKILPKVRRKECVNINEYILFPVQKEIISSATEKKTKLTEKEVDILKYLYQNQAQNVSKEELLENVWGYSAEATTHTVETHIYRLRQKVEENGKSQLIITENNGYRLNT